MWEWIKTLFSRLLRIFKQFIEEAFSLGVKILIAEFKDFAIDTVMKLADTDFSNEEKRQKAFEEIKTEAISRGKSLSTSVINTLIELAVQYLKSHE